jgi:hypothetical protein
MAQIVIQSTEMKEFSINNKHLVVNCSLTVRENIINAHVLIGCGGTATEFRHKDIIHYHQLEEKQVNTSRELKVMNGRPFALGTITCMELLHIDIWTH